MTPLCSRLDCTAAAREVLKLIAAEHKIELPTELEIKCRKGDLEKKIQFFWNFSLNSDPKAIQWDELHFSFAFDFIMNPFSTFFWFNNKSNFLLSFFLEISCFFLSSLQSLTGKLQGRITTQGDPCSHYRERVYRVQLSSVLVTFLSLFY